MTMEEVKKKNPWKSFSLEEREEYVLGGDEKEMIGDLIKQNQKDYECNDDKYDEYCKTPEYKKGKEMEEVETKIKNFERKKKKNFNKYAEEYEEYKKTDGYKEYKGIDGYDKYEDSDKHKTYKKYKNYDRYKLRLDLYPEPFIGNPDAPIYLLNLNPGFDETDKKDMGDLKEHILKSYQHEGTFYYLEDGLKIENTNGAKWWRSGREYVSRSGKKGKVPPRLGELIKEKEFIKEVRESIFCIEYFPYHSKGWKKEKEYNKLPSQIYSKELIETALEDENKIFIIMRSALYELIQKLKEAKYKDRIFFCSNKQSPTITKNNIVKIIEGNEKKEGFDEIVKRIKEYSKKKK